MKKMQKMPVEGGIWTEFGFGDLPDLYLDLWGGQALLDLLVDRGVTAKHAPAIAAIIKAVGFAKMGEWPTALVCTNDAVALIELVNGADQLDHALIKRFSKVIDVDAITLVLGKSI